MFESCALVKGLADLRLFHFFFVCFMATNSQRQSHCLGYFAEQVQSYRTKVINRSSCIYFIYSYKLPVQWIYLLSSK